MSEIIEITGGVPLRGSVVISGAKNAALPILMASLLTEEECVIDNVPNLADVSIALHLLETLGAETTFSRGRASLRVRRITSPETSYSLVKALRASFWVLAPLLVRTGEARVALPGGDIIGARPVDMHLAALGQMGAEISLKHGVVTARAPSGLKPARVDFRFPSVGATHQVLMAAAMTEGATTIVNAAREPEVVALANFLSSMGAVIQGAGTSEILIEGKRQLGAGKLRLIGDRVEAATYILAGAASRGDVTVRGIDPQFFGEFGEILQQLGLAVEAGADYLSVRATERLRPVKVSTGPFPQLATDIQALLMAALCTADGLSSIEENVYEGRFGHVSELCRMGADIQVSERVASIRGVSVLNGAPVDAHDIRAGAALVIAALGAEGVTRIGEVSHLRRGYENLEGKLSGLGAKVARRVEDAEDFMFTGC